MNIFHSDDDLLDRKRLDPILNSVNSFLPQVLYFICISQEKIVPIP